jgi:homoserine kinase
LIHVRAPASTANLGPGFDCVAVALALWNELEVEEDAEEPPDSTHLGVRAFRLLAPTEGRRFTFTDRIPQGRGLGSSAATIALGLVAGARAAGLEPDVKDLLVRGLKLESHADNLAAALAGGVCLTWSSSGRQRLARLPGVLPLVPIALVPEAHVETAAARAILPTEVPYEDAAFNAGRAALLGAGLASGDPELLAESFVDRLHEPYRAPHAPLLEEVRDELPRGAVGATLSGSGPTVIVWARPGDAEACERELNERFPLEQVLSLEVAIEGAG